MTPEERAAEIKRLQAERDHCQKMVERCILLGAAVLLGGMFLVMIMAMLGI